MLSDSQHLSLIVPTSADDRFVVRYMDGGLPQLEYILNLLPDDWELRHVSMVAPDRPVVIFAVGSPIVFGDPQPADDVQ